MKEVTSKIGWGAHTERKNFYMGKRIVSKITN